MGTIQRHKTLPQLLIEKALEMFPVSSRSGAYSGLGGFTPHLDRFEYTGPHSIQGMQKHAGEVRRERKNQRYRAYQKALRGKR